LISPCLTFIRRKPEMRDLKIEEIGHVYGATGGSCAPQEPSPNKGSGKNNGSGKNKGGSGSSSCNSCYSP